MEISPVESNWEKAASIADPGIFSLTLLTIELTMLRSWAGRKSEPTTMGVQRFQLLRLGV
jgi:hypothetical protein